MSGLRVLAVDDEPPALDELAYLLRADPQVAQVRTASDAVSALQELDAAPVDAVFLDIRMPGLSGLELARVLARYAEPPAVVFVTAHEDAAVEAFALGVVDYLLKPVRAERLASALARVAPAEVAAAPTDEGGSIAVERGGVTRFVAVTDVLYVEAQGDYARLHTGQDSHLVRVPMATLESRWSRAGFVRVHRSFLVNSAHIRELRVEQGGGHALLVGTITIPVSRRHTRELKDRLVRRARDRAES